MSMLPPKICENGFYEVEMTWERLKPKSMDSEHTRTSITDNSFHEVVSGASNYPDIDLHGSSETVEWS